MGAVDRIIANAAIVEALRGLYANFLVQEFIGEAEVKQQALAWVPAVMRFGTPKEEAIGNDETSARSEDANDELTEQAA